MNVDAERPLETDDDIKRRRRQQYEKKLAITASESVVKPQHVITYETLFRKPQGILLQGNAHEIQDGIILNTSRSAHNSMVSSK